MKTLKQHIEEGLLAGMETTLDNGKAVSKAALYEDACKIIDEFISANYSGRLRYKIKKRPNKDGKFIVDFAKHSYVELYPNATAFTNDMFVIGHCPIFAIKNNQNIVNLIGSPESVIKLAIEGCSSFESFEGIPNFVELPKEETPTLHLTNMQITDLMSLDKYLNIPESTKLDIRTCSKLTSLNGCPNTLKYLLLTWCDALKDLSGAPSTVHTSVEIRLCKGLQSLNGCPEHIGNGKWPSGFEIHDCHNLKSLDYCPKDVKGPIYIHSCKGLTSLEGLPKNLQELRCSGLNITSLKGAPATVYDKFEIDLCDNLTSLEGCPKNVGGLFAIQRCKNIDTTKEEIKSLCKTDSISLWASGKNNQYI